MASIYGRCGRSVIAVQNVPREETSRYGVVRTEEGSRSPHRIGGIVEKPAPEKAPSTLAVVARYILTPPTPHPPHRHTPPAPPEPQPTHPPPALTPPAHAPPYH